jgi:hypothetical protein
MIQCQKRACANGATHAVKLMVPAARCQIPEHDPIEIVFGLQLCEACAMEVRLNPSAVVSEALVGIVRAQARTTGKADPDFGRAFVRLIALDSDEWQRARYSGLRAWRPSPSAAPRRSPTSFRRGLPRDDRGRRV